jgi:hypothetical protein
MKIELIHGLCPVIGRNGDALEPARRRASIKPFQHLISPPWVKKGPAAEKFRRLLAATPAGFDEFRKELSRMKGARL